MIFAFILTVLIGFLSMCTILVILSGIFSRKGTNRSVQNVSSDFPRDGKVNRLPGGGHRYMSNWHEATEREKLAFEEFCKTNNSGGFYTGVDGHTIYFGKVTFQGGKSSCMCGDSTVYRYGNKCPVHG